MPGFDERLEQALRGAAVLPDRDPDAVAAAVAVKHRRRRIRRRTVTSLAVAAVVVTALAMTAVVVTRDPADDPRIVADPTVPPPTVSTAPPVTPSTVPPEDVAAAREEVPAAAPEGYEVTAPQVTVVAAGEAVATVTDAAGTRYEGVRFTETQPGQWSMTPASTCRLPGADPAQCAGVAPDVRVTSGKTRLDPTAYAGSAASVTPVALSTNEGYVRGPLVEANGALWAAAYDRVGNGYDYPPSHLVSFDPASGAVTRRIDLKGEILWYGEGDGLLWVVTHERFVDADGVEYRLKRVNLQTGLIETMTIPPDVPPAEQLVPAGPVVVVDGQPYIATKTGIIHFSLGGSAQTVMEMPAQERRGLAVVDGAVYATNGTTIRRVDPGARVPGDLVLETNATAPLTDLVVTGDAVLALASDGQFLWLDRAMTRVDASGALPPGMTNTELHASADRVWATGTADLEPKNDPAAQSVAVEPVAVLLDEAGISQTIVVAGGNDADLAVLTSGEMILTSGGNAYRVTLPT